MNEVADIGAVEAVSDEPLFDRSDATCLVERYNNSTACLFSSLVPTIGSQRAIIITDFHVRAYTWCPCVLFKKMDPPLPPANPTLNFAFRSTAKDRIVSLVRSTTRVEPACEPVVSMAKSSSFAVRTGNITSACSASMLAPVAIATLLLGCHSEHEDIINHCVLKVAVVRNKGAHLLLEAQHVLLNYRRIIKQCSRSYER